MPKPHMHTREPLHKLEDHPFHPNFDERPIRVCAAVNVDRADKRLLDQAQSALSYRYCRALTQPDVVSILLRDALANPKRELRRAGMEE